MREVSCRFFETPLRDLRERRIDPRRLTAGTPYTPELLATKDERVEWSALVQMMENARTLWSATELIRLGQRSTESPLVQYIGLVARVRFSVGDFYQWVTAPGSIARQMISCVETTSRRVSVGHVVVDFRMLPGYASSREFFLITQGTYAAMPRMLGAKPAVVTASELDDGVRFDIRFEEPRGVPDVLRRAARWPFNVRQAADELADAHRSLQARYDELDSTRAAVDQQRALLQTAYTLGQQALAQRDPETVARTIVQRLTEDARILGAELTIEARGESSTFRAGECPDPSAATSLALAPGRATHGRLSVWQRSDDDRSHTAALLELVAPTIALAIDNAIAYRELADYQQGLERRVEERTHDLSVARDELATTVRRLEEVQASRERLFQNISHEFRTPLALILLSVDTLLAALSPDRPAGPGP